MTIEYALTRTEIVRVYFLGFAGSRRFRGRILRNVATIGFFFLLLRVITTRTITSTDVMTAFLYVVAVLVFLPFWLFIRGKSAKRTLTISPEGIYTEIGSLKRKIPWSRIALVDDTASYVFITRSGGNSFFVPSCAFSDPSQREQFIASIRRWMEATG